jgi:hypothetical protein
MNRDRLEYRISSWAIRCCLIGILQVYAVLLAYASDNDVRIISGIVDEVHANETPPVIMVKSRPGMKDEIVIGAVVIKGASIVRGEQRIALNRIRAGERVTLTYVKNREGLTVRSIVVHSK